MVSACWYHSRLSHENATYHYRIPYVHCVDYSHGELFGGYNISVLGRDFSTAKDPKVFIGVPLRENRVRLRASFGMYGSGSIGKNGLQEQKCNCNSIGYFPS